jgi:predicted O-methyltransferase YrrM
MTLISFSKSQLSKLLLVCAILFLVFNGICISFSLGIVAIALNSALIILMLFLLWIRQVIINKAETQKQLLKEFHQVESLHYLNKIIKTPIPYHSRGWAASPDLLVELIRIINQGGLKHIVECGAGISTVYLGLYCKEQNLPIKITSIEHDETFVKVCNQRIEEMGIQDITQIVHAPLTEFKDATYSGKWYDTSKLISIKKIDLLLVDGPISSSQNTKVRYLALPYFKSALNPNAKVVMDDYMRKGEKEIVESWKAEFSTSIQSVQELYLEKEAAIITMQP